MKRADITKDCPKEFEDKLNDFIDDIEGKAVDIKETLDISGISHISDIEDAYKLSVELCSDLY